MSKDTATAVPTEREFGTDAQIDMTRKQIASFFKHTNNDAVLRELEIIMKSGRDAIGWKHTGRLFIEAFKEAPFTKN